MVQLLAFSLQDQVEKYGAYIGIAAFFGLAVLTILYFSQARELRRLRDWAGRAPERAQEIEARAVASAQAARQPPAPRPVPATAAAAAGGGATAASAAPATEVVEETKPTNGTTEAAAGAPEAPEQASGGNGGPPEAKEDGGAKAAAVAAGAAAAAKAGEEKSDEADEAKPEDEANTDEAEKADDAAPADEAKPDEAAKPEASEPAAEAEATPEESKPAADAVAKPDTGEIPVAPVPRATPLPRRAPAPAAPLRQPNRSTTLPKRPAPPQQRRSPVTPAASNPRGSRGLLIGGAIAILALVVIALFVTGVLGGSDKSSTPPAPNTTATPSAGGTPVQGSAALAPKTTKVAVLNGTTIPGLASTEKDKLIAAGFVSDNVTTGNNTDQAQAQSQVLYGTRSGARAQARTISQKLDISSLQRLDADTRDLSENADVVVILGQDKAP